VINWIIPEKEFHNFLKGLVDAGFGNRIMFGSDQMTWPQTIEIGINAVNNADFLTLKQKEDIFYNNAAQFFGLSDEEIKVHKGK
jgi:predicted TIM-barrel fold metal-dependent hydrolase